MVVNAESFVLGRMFGKELDADPNARVRDIMSPGPSTFRPNVSAIEMLEYMHRNDLETAPVTTPDGRLVGLVVRADVKRAASRKA